MSTRRVPEDETAHRDVDQAYGVGRVPEDEAASRDLGQACAVARRRALARLRKGYDLAGVRPFSRDEVHGRAGLRVEGL
ncbi:MAG: hypothetical protein OXH04_18780, partial [Acidobacteria bacterium]|nr:hypothetical protein [Acidobacteriota bacterium]